MAQALNVAVIGGGLAGLSAATKLAEQGIEVTVFEAAPQLGGRARGLNWKGQRLDNGQHILLGAYQQTLAMMQLTGVDASYALLRLPLALHMHQALSLNACQKLPAPLHLMAGLLFAKGVTWAERLAAMRFFIGLKLTRFKLKTDEPVLTLLNRKKQTAKLIKSLWEPLCLAALNTPTHIASAQIYLNVLRDSFAGKKSDSDLLIPKVDLSELMIDPMASYLQQRSGKVLLNNPVSQIKLVKSGFKLQTQDGETLGFSHIIVATSPFRANDLGLTLNTTAFSYQPIVTIYLQYPDTVKLPRVMTGFTQGFSQWVFDKGMISGQAGLLAVIISAEGEHQKLSQQALAEQVASELAQAFPELPAPLWHKVIAEKRATFACTSKLKRPSQITSIPNLYLAGDYTAGEYPATIEGAVRSGLICADAILKS